MIQDGVLNLIITGIPSILRTNLLERELISVLNLIITGIPSIQMKKDVLMLAAVAGFKPYYNWNTFNTQKKIFMKEYQGEF